MNESLVLLPQTPPTASIGNRTPPHSLQINPSSSVTSVCHTVTTCSTPKIKQGYFVPLHAKGISPICKTLFQATSSCVLNIPTVGVEDAFIRWKRSQSTAQLKDQQKQKRIRDTVFDASKHTQSWLILCKCEPVIILFFNL